MPEFSLHGWPTLTTSVAFNCVKICGNALIAGISQSRVQLFRTDLIRGHC